MATSIVEPLSSLRQVCRLLFTFLITPLKLLYESAGDLSDHIEESEDQERAKLVAEAIASGRRVEVSSGSPWEPIAVGPSHIYLVTDSVLTSIHIGLLPSCPLGLHDSRLRNNGDLACPVHAPHRRRGLCSISDGPHLRHCQPGAQEAWGLS